MAAAETPHAQASDQFRAIESLWLLGLLGLTLALFWPVRHFAFLNLDDDRFVTENAMVTKGLSVELVQWAFSTTEQGHYQPLTWLTHAADVSLFGLDAGAHHTTSLLLFLIAVALCFFAFRSLSGRFDVAILTAALFAVHPLRIEVVAWVADRKDLVSAVFFFAALWSHAERRRTAAFALYGLALLSKPTVLPLPLLFVLLEFWPARPTQPSIARAIRANVAPLLLMVAYSVVPFLAQRSARAVSAELWPGRAAVHLISYFGRFIWPADISILHPLRLLPPGLEAAAVLAVVCLAAWAAVRLISGGDSLAFGVLWALALLLPVCGVVQIGSQSIADRWLLLPSAGLAAGVLAALPNARLRLVLGGGAVLACALSTRAQLPTFASSEAVFTRALELAPDNLMAHVNLGIVYERKGETELAFHHYERAAALNDASALPLNNLGAIAAKRGDEKRARELFGRAVSIEPAFAPARYNLARALMGEGRFEEALVQYRAATELDPLNAMAALGHGVTLLRLGNLKAGVTELKRSVSLDPTSAEAWAYLARGSRMVGLMEQAREALERALALDPNERTANDERLVMK